MSEFDYRDVLLKAASYVEQDWCQGVPYLGEDIPLYPESTDPELQGYRDYEASLRAANAWCLTGAIQRALSDLLPADLDDRDEVGYDLEDRAFKRVWHLLDRGPVGWNDDPDRTADEVAEALRQAADA